jgi:fungal STAND N-terminal Goodbye domain
MASTSTSASASRFESIFNSALDAYRKRTRQDLASNPLLPSLQSCDSPDAIINLLRDQIPAFSQSQTSDDRVSKWLIPTVNVLYSFSAVLGEGVGLVNSLVPFSGTSVLISVPQVFSPAKVIFAGIGVLFLVCIFHVSLSQIMLTSRSLRPPKM